MTGGCASHKPESAQLVLHSIEFSRQRGALVVSLLMLMAILTLGIAGAQIALQGSKSSRNDRDRQIAFQAAEAALIDAEMDIEASPDATKSRSHVFSKDSTLGFPDEGEQACNSGSQNLYLGLCRRALSGAIPVWQTVDFTDGNFSTMSSVPYGTFTGQRFEVGKGNLPARLPRYIIELFFYSMPGESANMISYFYRVTAVGFGARESTQVALQTFYRKESR